jgi:putative peptide zinc metalloprotease protein
MRFDGYYILSDMLEIPNLRTKSSTSLSRLAKKWCLGVKLQDDPFLPKRNQGLFALYSIASTIYMWVLMTSIFHVCLECDEAVPHGGHRSHAGAFLVFMV